MLLFIDPDEARQQRDNIDRVIEQVDERLQIQVVLNIFLAIN